MEKRTDDKAVPCGAPIFVLIVLDIIVGLNLIICGLELK